MEIQKARSPNYWFGNKGRIAIVDHITAGLMPGCLSWMCNSGSGASAHYLVTRDGEIYNLVDDLNSAWHAGVVKNPSWPLYDGTNPNWYTLGIEHEGWPDEPLTEEQYQATLWLHRKLIEKWDIPIDEDHIIGHYRIDSINRANCPGPEFPWERLFQDLRGGDVMQTIKVNVRGQEVPAVLVGNKTYVELDSYVKATETKVIWDPVDKVVTVK